jgi:two-component system response regulator VanR
MGINIMIVEDEPAIADLIGVYLKNENYQVHVFYTGKPALASLESISYDLAILDVMLPDIDGFTICKKIREAHFFPIIMLTAKIEDIDKITGLTIGADDYITKPFNPIELVARVKTQIRRYKRYNHAGTDTNASVTIDRSKYEYDFSGLIINKDTHKCSLYGSTLNLTPLEFNILWYLCENKGRVVPTEELFENVWGERYMNSNNTVMAHIARLREKMNEPSRKPKFIKTVWGVGYTIE